MHVTLSVIQGPHQGRVFALDRHETFFVGRGKNAHFRLGVKDQFFSRLHFLIELNPPRCRITDLNSTNGTFVNGKKIQSVDLKSGDLIEGGDTVIRVEFRAADLVSDEKEGPRDTVIAEDSVKSNAPQKPLRTDFTIPAPLPSPLASSSPSLVPESSTRERVPVLQRDDGSRAASKPPAEVTLEKESRDELVCPGCARPPRTRMKGLVCDDCEAEAVDCEQVVPGYRLIKELGRGGMGIVFLGVSEKDSVARAVKVISGKGGVSERDAARFLREAETLQALSHPNIVSFAESGEICGLLYFAMEFVRGMDATKISKSTAGGITPRRIITWACGLLDALGYAHAKGYVHRDIKPQNLLIGEERGQEVVKLADFGLARAFSNSPISGLTFTGDIAGTLYYMAPEQLLNLRDTKPSADIYSTGALMFHLLTQGKRHYNFPENITAQMTLLLQEEPLPLSTVRPGLPSRLYETVDRALAREPADRFHSAEEMKRSLMEVLRAARPKP